MTAEEPTPPAPLPEGTGEKEQTAPPSAIEAQKPSSPFPSGRAVGSWRLALGVVALALAAFAVWYFALRGPRDDLAQLQGEWRLSVADRAKQFPIAVRVKGDRWVYLVGDQEQKRYTLTLRPDANPKEIDLVQLGPDDKPLMEKQKRDEPFTPVTLRGVYALEDGKMKVVFAPSPLPRPTALDADDGPPVWVLEKF